MRLMINPKTGQKLKIKEWFMLKNGWEYYVIKGPKLEKDIEFCLVLGFEDEMGDVYLPEVAPYVVARTQKLDEVRPAVGWEWGN